jgi:hypothetical protein
MRSACKRLWHVSVGGRRGGVVKWEGAAANSVGNCVNSVALAFDWENLIAIQVVLASGQ